MKVKELEWYATRFVSGFYGHSGLLEAKCEWGFYRIEEIKTMNCFVWFLHEYGGRTSIRSEWESIELCKVSAQKHWAKSVLRFIGDYCELSKEGK